MTGIVVERSFPPRQSDARTMRHVQRQAQCREKRRALETENAKLKRLLAERDLELDAMREIVPAKVVSPQARRR